ncbi:MAG: thioesterase family protein [Acidimicrobiia bacterium]|nr:thioesterase family protein [Acidimicrobiia bacterium]NNK91429.1 thioesterase family protein [Acidimicrobiia bacterium]
MSFAEASAVEPAGEGRWTAEIQPRWDIAGAANGGYLLSVAARASALAADRPDPASVTAHFLAPASPGPVTIETEILKAGRRFTTVRAVMTSAEGRPLAATLGSFTDLAEAAGVERVDAQPPELPPVEDCIPVEPTDTFPPPFMAQVELRLHPEDFGFGGPTSGVPRIRGWFRWREDEPLDTIGLLVATDAFPPTIFNANLPVAWTPTLELTTHVRFAPHDDHEWLRCAFTTRFITGGFLEEDGELWDDKGRLMAQSRQLALVPRG